MSDPSAGSPLDSGEPESPNPNSARAFDTLRDWLEEDDWHPQQLDDQMIYRTFFAGKNGDMRCYAQIVPDMEQFLFYVVASTRAPEEVRLAVAEFLTRANYGMRIGNFELDYSDGEVRYKTSLDFEDETLSPNLIRNMVYPGVMTMDRYLPGLMKVMFGGLTPYEAIQSIENPD